MFEHADMAFRPAMIIDMACYTVRLIGKPLSSGRLFGMPTSLDFSDASVKAGTACAGFRLWHIFPMGMHGA